METNESLIRSIITKVINEMTKLENFEKKKLYVVVTESLRNPLALFEQLYTRQDVEIIILLPECLSQEKFMKVFPEKNNYKFVFHQNRMAFPTGNFDTVILGLDKTSIAKIAMGISDTFMTKWIEHCFEQGQDINILRSEIQVLTGKEPLAYQQKFKDYIKTLSDYEIKVINELNELLSLSTEVKVESFIEERSKNIITYNDIFKYQQYGKVILRKQDIITDLAKEKAKDLGILIDFK